MRHVVGVIGHVMAPGLKPGFHQAQDVGIQSLGTVVLLALALEQSPLHHPHHFCERDRRMTRTDEFQNRRSIRSPGRRHHRVFQFVPKPSSTILEWFIVGL
jgi:hypothetical protein